MIYAIVVVLILIADQAVKYLTTLNIPFDKAQPVIREFIPGVIHFTNVHNEGAAFSILEGAQWFLIAVSAAFVIAIIVLISREVIHTTFGKWTAVLVVAGALGNCIDRILYGYVVDMIGFSFFTFPVFNVADMFITIGGILFCVHLLFYKEPEAVKAANEPEFIRRRREEKAAKEAPYANIPKRGEHKTLAEELAAEDPDDPFAEWSFGETVEPDAPAQTSEAPETEERLPEAAAEEPAPEADGAPAPEAAPEADDGGEEEFTLEDILSEFGDF